MIYDFYKDVGYSAIIVFFVLSLIVTGLTVWQVFCTVRFSKQHILSKTKIEIFIIEFFIRIIIVITTLILSIAFIVNLIKLSKMYYLYDSNKCSIITGNISQISSERNDYRDNEQYDISFNIDNTHFSNTNISCTKELLDELLELENNEITVFYTKTDSGYFIHSIRKGGLS